MHTSIRKAKGPAALASGALAAALIALPARDARACGCFAPPDPSVPIVQAGERIVFAMTNGHVTAHIQIQYQGDANDFGWLLPLPSVPTMKLGVDELFLQLTSATQPKYRLNRITSNQCAWAAQNGRGPVLAAAGNANAPEDSSSPLVLQSSIGPYNYAVLKADNMDAMFNWLTNNHYFIPTGTADVVGPYIHPGGYFLALQLKKGASTGDLQPVIVDYDSDLPMIPIILSSVAANPNMGIQVWMLGDSRAIPRNYRHTILNDEHIDWLNAGQNYNDVVIKAVAEANGKHSFITEYAGTTDIMKNVLDPPGRFGVRATFEQTTDALAYVQLLRQSSFAINAQPSGGFRGGPGLAFSGTYPQALIDLLAKTFPFPDGVKNAGVPQDQYYQNLDFYLGSYRDQNPSQFAGASFTFDPVALTGDIWDRIVTPTLDAGRLFTTYSKVTRLYTTLSPEDMNLDPVFSFNKDLPDVSNIHEATFTYICGYFQDGPSNTPAVLKLPDGREFYVTNQTSYEARNISSVPFSSRIEILHEEGPPVVEVDNAHRISQSDVGGCGCKVAHEPSAATGISGLFGVSAIGTLLAAAIVLLPRRRRS
jgi:hypothetical protein